MSLGRRRKEGGGREVSKQVHLGCPLSVCAQLPPPSSSEGANVSVGGFPGSSTACVPIPLQTAASSLCAAYPSFPLHLLSITPVSRTESYI